MQALPTYGIWWHLDTGLPSLQKWRNTFLLLEASLSMMLCESCPDRLRLEQNRLNLSRWRHSPRLSGHMHTARLLAHRAFVEEVIGFSLFCLATVCAILFSVCEDSTSFYSYLGFFIAPSSEPCIAWETSGQRGDRKPLKTQWLLLQVGSGARPVLTSVWPDSVLDPSLLCQKWSLVSLPVVSLWKHPLCQSQRGPCTLWPPPALHLGVLGPSGYLDLGVIF